MIFATDFRSPSKSFLLLLSISVLHIGAADTGKINEFSPYECFNGIEGEDKFRGLLEDFSELSKLTNENNGTVNMKEIKDTQERIARAAVLLNQADQDEKKRQSIFGKNGSRAILSFAVIGNSFAAPGSRNMGLSPKEVQVLYRLKGCRDLIKNILPSVAARFPKTMDGSWNLTQNGNTKDSIEREFERADEKLFGDVEKLDSYVVTARVIAAHDPYELFPEVEGKELTTKNEELQKQVDDLGNQIKERDSSLTQLKIQHTQFFTAKTKAEEECDKLQKQVNFLTSLGLENEKLVTTIKQWGTYKITTDAELQRCQEELKKVTDEKTKLATGLDEFMKRNTKLLEDAATNQKTTTELGQQLTELQKKLKTALEKSNSGNTQPKSRVSFLPNRSFWAGSFLTGLGTLGVWKFGGILLALLPKLSWLLPL